MLGFLNKLVEKNNGSLQTCFVSSVNTAAKKACLSVHTAFKYHFNLSTHSSHI